MTTLSAVTEEAPNLATKLYGVTGGNSRRANLNAYLNQAIGDPPDPADYATVVKASGLNDPGLTRGTGRATYVNYNNSPNTGGGNKIVMALKGVTASAAGSLIWRQRTFVRAEHAAVVAGLCLRKSSNGHLIGFGQLKDAALTFAMRQVGFTDATTYAGGTYDVGVAAMTERPMEWFKVTWSGNTTFRLFASFDGNTFFAITPAQDIAAHLADFDQLGFMLNVARGSGISGADDDAHLSMEISYLATTGLA